LTLDAEALQTLRMALSALTTSAQKVDAQINQAVQAAVEAAQVPEVAATPEIVRAPKGVNGMKHERLNGS
jgi:hypothetical protein